MSLYIILLYVLYVSAIDHLNPRGVPRARGNSIYIDGIDTLALLLYIYTHSCVSITHYCDHGLCKVVYEKYNI